jgi:hypothetical protein
MVDGWPIAHHVFEGNKRDAKTVPDVMGDLEAAYHRADAAIQKVVDLLAAA